MGDAQSRKLSYYYSSDLIPENTLKATDPCERLCPSCGSGVCHVRMQGPEEGSKGAIRGKFCVRVPN